MMHFSDEYNKFDLRTRSVASYISTEERIQDLHRIKKTLSQNHRRTIDKINELIASLESWNRDAKKELDEEPTP